MTESSRNWAEQARCKADPDSMFVAGAEQNIAKRICRSCVVKSDCLADALDNRIEFGVWGGMTERQRRAVLRRHPDVPSWRDLLQAAAQKAAEEAAAANREGGPTEVAGAAGATAMGAETPDSPQVMPWPRAPGLPEEDF